MPVLTVANSKGGTGKTLVCAVLCARLASDGVRVAAIDADPNRTLYEWRSQVYEGPAFECRAEPDAARLAHMIPELADTYLSGCETSLARSITSIALGRAHGSNGGR
jgi:chromosome partitioning protein